MSEPITVTANELLESGDDFFRREPALTSLHITDAAGLIKSLAQSPLLGHLTSLGLSGNWITPADAAAIAQSPNLRSLEHLVMHNCALGDEGLREFALCSQLDHLHSWVLTDNGLSDAGLAFLASSAHFPEVKSLSFGHYGVASTRYDSVTRQGLMPLAVSPELINLSTIHWYELTDRRDVPDSPVIEELIPGVQLVTHVEQMW
jgi:hypothetical protein